MTGDSTNARRNGLRDGGQPNGLPLRRHLQPGEALTLFLAALMGGMSLVGLILPDRVYPSEELIQAYLVNDLINLLIGMPILLGPLWLIRRDSWIGLLCWPGAVIYVLYNSIVYLTGLPFGLVTVVHLAIILLGAYILYLFLKGIDPESVQNRLAGKVPEKLGGGVLLIFGILFILRAVSAIAAQVTGQAVVSLPDLGLLIADLALSTVWILGGAALLRRRAAGYANGLGLLFAGSMLFIGLIAVFLLQPVLTAAPLVLTDVLVVFLMGMVCFIPFGLYARGVISQGDGGKLSASPPGSMRKQ